MITIPASIALELHKVATDSSVIALLEIPEHSICLARNTQDVVWNGKTFQKFWFEFGDVEDLATDKVPEITVQTSNVGGYMEREIIEHDNFEDSTAILYCVNSACLNETTPIFQVTMQVMKPIVDRMIAALKLSAENPLLNSYPSRSYHASVCQYPEFKGALCGYSGAYKTCSRSLYDCLMRGNQERFGGQLGLSDDYVDLDE